MQAIAIRPLRSDEIEEIVQLSLQAWAPVFASFEEMLGREIFLLQYPDWRASQRAAVESVCGNTEKYHTWVAHYDRQIAGFVAYELNEAEQVGEVYMVAVHPEMQNRGIGTALNNFALQKLKEAGMKLAVVATGGDPGHAPARRTYEKVGYRGFPQLLYYKKL